MNRRPASRLSVKALQRILVPATADRWIQPQRRNYLLACCDCGLIHRLDFRLAGTPRRRIIQFRAEREDRATARWRRATHRKGRRRAAD